MTTQICRRCGTYCYGDCAASEGRTWTAPRPAQSTATRPAHQSKIVINGVPKTREAWEARLAADEARLARITDAGARAITERMITTIRTALEV